MLDLGLASEDRVRLDFALDMGAEVVGTVRGPDGPVPNAVVGADHCGLWIWTDPRFFIVLGTNS